MHIDGLGNICLWCFEEKGEGSLCSHCGHDERELKSPEQALPAGTVIGSHYVLGKVLGQGGFGITYIAYDRDLRVKRAVKEFFPQGMVVRTGTQLRVSRRDSQDVFQKGVDSFYREAKSLARFGDHPNVVKIHDLFHENGTAYFVMDYIEGVSFRQYLKAHGDRIPWEDALRILRPIGDALTTLHEAHLLHRDIKPDNIFLTEKGTPILLDFGAARYETKEKTHSSAAVLTPGYAPPEQYGSLVHQGPYTDVYALAATFYRAVSGSVPVPSSDRVMGDTLVPLNRADPQIPPYISAAVSHAMQIKSTERTNSVALFFDELDRRKSGSGIPKWIVPVGILAVCALVVFLFGRERIFPVSEKSQLPAAAQTLTITQPQLQQTAEPVVLDTAQPSPADTAVPTATDISQSSPTSTDTAIPVVIDTPHPSPTSTDTAVPIATDTVQPTSTDTAVPTATDTVQPTSTDTAVPTATDTVQPTSTDTAIPTATDTPQPSPTATEIPFQMPEAPGDIRESGFDYIPDIQDILRSQVGDLVWFGHLDRDNEPRSGKESIVWRVLAREDDRILLLSEYALDAGSFNERKESTFWSYSTLRIWLNEEFYREAFSSAEQAMILQSQVQADSAHYTLDSGRDSQDHIFLLSASEAETYFAEDWDRVCRPTERSLVNGASLFESLDMPASVSWWLRSSGEDKQHAAYVMEDGSVSHTGADVDRSNIAIRPAFWLSLADVPAGTACTTAETCFYNALRGDEKAVELIREKARQRYASAQCLMGYLCCWSSGMEKDEAAAAEWFRLAAEQGSAEGQYALGVLYLMGSGVPQDAAKAAEWFRRAAEQGNTLAQYRLAALYEQGIGVPEDVSAAELWYQMAAVSARSAEFEKGYEKPLFGQEIVDAQEGDRLYYGHLDQDKNIANGVEPVLWRVLKRENDRLLLISEHGLERLPYHTVQTEVSWETSSLRTWLNEAFYQLAFNDAEKAGISETLLPARSFFENDTTDKLFLLNIEESSRYFESSEDRQCRSSGYAVASSITRSENGYAAWWLLDSMDNNVPSAALIDADGRIVNEGYEVDKENILVRPVFRLSLSELSF